VIDEGKKEGPPAVSPKTPRSMFPAPERKEKRTGGDENPENPSCATVHQLGKEGEKKYVGNLVLICSKRKGKKEGGRHAATREK